MKIIIEVSGGMIANVKVPMGLANLVPDLRIEIRDFDSELYSEEELETETETGEQYHVSFAEPEVLLD